MLYGSDCGTFRDASSAVFAHVPSVQQQPAVGRVAQWFASHLPCRWHLKASDGDSVQLPLLDAGMQQSPCSGVSPGLDLTVVGRGRCGVC